jgi:hypothetical protein
MGASEAAAGLSADLEPHETAKPTMARTIGNAFRVFIFPPSDPDIRVF